MTGHSANFRTALKSIARGEVLAPAIRAFVMNPKFGGLDIKVRGMGQRRHDGYFHPSTHPLWSERSLWLYLTDADRLDIQEFDAMSVFSMTAGTIWHEVIQHILHDQLGILDSKETPVHDAETMSRGHMDGVMGDEIFELKTMKDFSLSKIESVDDYIAKYPTYYAQAIEYMRLSGLRKERVLLLSPTYPFAMKEFVIEYDAQMAEEIRQKYLRVRQAFADGKIPDSCCGQTSCPARSMCLAL